MYKIMDHKKLLKKIMKYENIGKVKAQMIIDAFIAKFIDPDFFNRSVTYRSTLSRCKPETILFLEWITEIRES